MAHIELELQGYKVREASLKAAIVQRKRFTSNHLTEGTEAANLHNDALKNEERQLSEVQELIAQQEKAIADSVKPEPPTPKKKR